MGQDILQTLVGAAQQRGDAEVVLHAQRRRLLPAPGLCGARYVF
jgi:hypothetical protein